MLLGLFQQNLQACRLEGAATLAAITASGGLTGGAPSILSGTATLGGITASGLLAVVPDQATSYGGTPPGITGTHYGGSRLGTPGSQVPSEGANGPGYLYAGLSLPSDAAVEVRGPITRWPAGTLTVYEDSSFSYVGASDYALYRLYQDGVASTVDIGYGPGIGRIELNVGATATLSGNAALGAIVASGSFSSGAVSVLGGTAALGAITASGGFLSESLGPCDPAAIWAHVLPNGLTAAETVTQIHTMLTALHQIHGLQVGMPLVVTPTSRTAGPVSQTITSTADATTVTRT